MALCFKDMSFCSTDCVNTACYRNFSPKLRQQAKEWWGKSKGEPPVAFMNLMCDKYMPPDSPCDDWSKVPLNDLQT